MLGQVRDNVMPRRDVWFEMDEGRVEQVLLTMWHNGLIISQLEPFGCEVYLEN
jgi:hypothetical protein